MCKFIAMFFFPQTDQNNHMSFEQLNPCAICEVLDLKYGLILLLKLVPKSKAKGRGKAATWPYKNGRN